MVYDQYRDTTHNQPAYRPAPTAVAITNKAVTVQDDTAMAWLRVICYVVVIITCGFVVYSLVELWMAVHKLGEGLQQISQTWGN